MRQVRTFPNRREAGSPAARIVTTLMIVAFLVLILVDHSFLL